MVGVRRNEHGHSQPHLLLLALLLGLLLVLFLGESAPLSGLQ